VKAIGWYRLELASPAVDNPLLSGCGAALEVFHWRGDAIELPKNAVHLAEEPACRQQAFCYSASADGLQFHLEVAADAVR
jgi:GMP synthase-like glutamine amidotransferase